MRFKRITDIIGRTPLLEIPIKRKGWKFFIKLEKFNPGRSMKARTALGMVARAEREGKLKPGGTIIESSSGNTAVGLAVIAAERGYKFIAVVDRNAHASKVAAIRAYGGKVVYIDESYYKTGKPNSDERERLARKFDKEIPNSLFTDQINNPGNPEGFFDTLGQEIIDDTDGEVDILIAAVGTGGSLGGTARRIKKHNKDLYVIGVEPKGSLIFGGPKEKFYQLGAGRTGLIGKNMDYDVIDKGAKVSDVNAFNTARYFAKNGILVGGAAGGVIYTALETIKNHEKDKGTVVIFTADGGEEYLDSTYDDEWMKERDLIDLSVEKKLEEMVDFKRNHGSKK